jgi:diguanylate cyclase (GGDEF)-like protein/putative nucleotidyltransferase with HDIG domain
VPSTDGATPAPGQITCSMASTLLRHVRARLGEQTVDELVRMSGVPYTTAHLDDVSNWIAYEEAVALFEAGAAVTGDEQIARRVGEETVRQHAGTTVATLMRSLGSPEAVFEQLSAGVTKFSTVTDLTPVSVVPGQARLRAKARPGFKRHRRLCDWTLGLLSQPPVLFGLPPAAVEQSACEVNGDDHCEYTVTWDADRAASAADPQELVTALEAQMVGMSERLENMYATARDLIAFDDVDAALARITERAATAVRAPRYLLAVRTGLDGRVHVHHRGFVGEDPDAVARALLEDDTQEEDAGRLVADVESRTRHYGKLLAVSPAGGFFPQERDLFSVYARYAASVLDTATALEDARGRQRESRALLELSRAVAQVTSADEVAQRLVEAVPAVVDCDRVGVFLWDEQQSALTCRAVTELGVAASGQLRELRIRPTDSPSIARQIEHVETRPHYAAFDTEDVFLAGVMGRLGSVAVALVPIVAHERYFGFMSVSVVDRPERLRMTSALDETLAGVSAQAATALENAGLIESMAHQARHDSLTGLLSHRAFQESLEAGVRGGGDGAFTLALIDIDDFKLVNDLYGHTVGDDALRVVTDALQSSVRDRDLIFRVGGEEFAVILPGLSAEDAIPVVERLRAAVAATGFTVPLRVSIGLASWPRDATDRGGLFECADAALYAAKHAGKDCTIRAEPDQRIGTEGPLAQGLLNLLRVKDGETLAHCAQVAALVVKVGAALGLDGDRLAQLRLAGQLHDIGKVAVPDHVLTKPDSLDEDELRLVHTHPAVGAEILTAWGFGAIARFVREHHEHVDGGGYPAGLRGEEITLEGRIIHAVDAFAAMTADRPYREAMSVEDALAELRACSGTQFDAQIVEAVEREVETIAAAAAQSGQKPSTISPSPTGSSTRTESIDSLSSLNWSVPEITK